MKPPVAACKPHETTVHGVKLADEYFWMRDRDNPEVISYLEAENAYTEKVLAADKDLEKRLYEEMLGRIKETDLSVPVRMGNFYYYHRTEKGKQYPIYCRKEGSLDAVEACILDMNALAEGHSYFSLGVFEVSPDHRLLAYSTDTNGSEVHTLFVKDLKTGLLRPEVISNTATSLEWAEDNRTLFYSVLDEAKRPFKIMRHQLGTPVEEDTVVFEDPDESFFVSISKTKDRRFLFVTAESKSTTEVWMQEASRPKDSPRCIEARRTGHEYYVDHHDGKLLILTNDGAQNFKLMEAAVESVAQAFWKEKIPHRPEVKLEGIDVFRDFLVVYERFRGLMHIRMLPWKGGEPHEIDFPEPVYTAWGGQNPEYETEWLRFGYSSLVTPNSVFDYNMHTRARELKKQQEVLGGYDPGAYLSERIWARSHDGVEVPISLVYRRGLKKNGKNPFFLYGYGAYGISIDPNFSSNRISLLDRGFVFAIAHIRGGGDLGRPWYDEGKLMKKRNSFEDFIACASHVIKEGYTCPEKLTISGGSAGGLLMGAVVNQRPDLFAGVLMHVPFVDVMNTMLDADLPLTVTEYEEWGNPNEPEAFHYILSYSPYDNIKAAHYPAMLVTGGLHDPRVQYWEPSKWVARLRRLKMDSRFLLLKMNMGAGHGGASGRYDFLKEIALDYVFILKVLEMNR